MELETAMSITILLLGLMLGYLIGVITNDKRITDPTPGQEDYGTDYFTKKW